MTPTMQEEMHVIKPQIKFFLVGLPAGVVGLLAWVFVGSLFMAIISLLTNSIIVYVTFYLFGLFVCMLGSVIFTMGSLSKTEYRFYADRVEYYEGFLVKNRKTILYSNVSNISQRKGVFEGLFNLGTIFVDTAGYSRRGHELSMKFMHTPDQVYDWISQLVGNAKQK